MADVRALLAAERQSRRITNPHLTYSKTGALTCTVCDLNVKSEQLWSGHLKSLNHRKNVLKASELPPRPAKRKIETVETDERQERDYEVDSRKKPKSAPESQEIGLQVTEPKESAAPLPTIPEPDPQAVLPDQSSPQEQAVPPLDRPTVVVDEDEWAAFERDVAEAVKPDFASATIEAAPVSAIELGKQQKANMVQQREDEAEAEKEDESRRMEEEFELMEEMEDRVKRLRARREALRTTDSSAEVLIEPVQTEDKQVKSPSMQVEQTVDGDSSEEDEDDWYV